MTRPIDRRSMLRAGAAALASTTIAACGARSTQETTPEVASDTAAVVPAAVPELAIGKAGDAPLTFPAEKFGMGGSQLGSIFKVTSDQQAYDTLEASWEAGVRYFDTSPLYGIGISERRLGNFLDGKDPNEYIISTKVGRILYPDAEAEQSSLWTQKSHFGYRYDYTAEGVRTSLEHSLQRLGLPKVDIVLIHDLAPSNSDFEDWRTQLDIALSGAMPELSRLRDEGYIRGWGMGVNDLEPAIAAIEGADPDVILQAKQYSLIHHHDAVERLLPLARANEVGIIVAAPLDSGFLGGADRWNWGREAIPADMLALRTKASEVAEAHSVDLRTAALQFTTAPDVVVATIPGPRDATQARANFASMSASIPGAFWDDLRTEGVLHADAAVPS